MLLSEAEVQRCLTLVERAFPRFNQWEFVNEPDESYSGFCVWGRYQANPDSSSPGFFVTFCSSRNRWTGHLTVGKHCYYWSSADVGDAHLLGTDACSTIEESIVALKRSIQDLATAFLGPCDDTGVARTAADGPLGPKNEA